MGKEITLPVCYDIYWSYTWTPKWKNPSCVNCANPVMRIFDSVTYNLSIEDYRKCFKSSYKYVIRLYPDIVVRVPTAFSPNGDGNNDILYARGFGIKKLVSFKIFNRQGQLIFYTNDEKTGWDGNYKDLPQNSDVFYYTYEAESFIPGKIVAGEGNFMLLR
jgi:gliding motility-associated-like protein